MRIKLILTSLFLAGAALSGVAQTHAEGEEYYKADQINNAKELLLRNLNNPGTDKAIADFYLGLIAMEEGKTTDAAKYFNEGAQANPEYPFNFVGLGYVSLKNGDTKIAEQNFKQAEKLGKKDASVQVAIARSYYNVDPTLYQKQIDKALEKARKTNIKNPDIYIFEGDMLKDTKDWGGSAAKYEMAANYDNNATAAYVKYANLFTQVNPQYAINMLGKLLELNPNSALGQREIASAYYNNQNFDKAVEAYSKYINNPNHFKQDEDRYAFLLFYGGNYQEGYDYSSQLLKANPQNFTAHRYQFMNAAQIPALKDQLLPMAEALYKAHQSNPANKFAPIDYILIAEEFNAAKRPDEAVAVLEEAIKDDPTNANYNKQLAMAYVGESKLPQAADAYEGYIQKTEKPNFNDFIQQATFAFYAAVQSKDNAAEANRYYDMTTRYADMAAKEMPNHYKPKKIAGDIAKQQASADQVESAAVPAYQEALSLLEASENPARYKNDAMEMYNYLGNYYLTQNDKAKAKEYFSKVLEYDPDNADYRKFVEGL